MLKTFWGWREEQLPDGSVIWRLPTGHSYVTTPGSALLFPSLCAPTAALPAAAADPAAQDYCAERTAMMPRRRRTRAQDRATRIATERHHNRQTRQSAQITQTGPAPSGENDPPPF